MKIMVIFIKVSKVIMDGIKIVVFSMKKNKFIERIERLEREFVEKKRMIREGENIIRDLEYEM